MDTTEPSVKCRLEYAKPLDLLHVFMENVLKIQTVGEDSAANAFPTSMVSIVI